MTILHVASECSPWSQTGGLGQVAGALPDALVADGAGEVYVLTPLHRQAATSLAARGEQPVATDLVVHHYGMTGHLLRLDRPGRATILFLDSPALYDRGWLYGHDDDLLRFSLLAHATTLLVDALQVDVVHAHDWQAALVPTLLRDDAVRAVFTIHNLAYQGVFPAAQLGFTGLGTDVYTIDGLEFWEQINLLKGAVSYADAITTVSPSYAAEIQTAAFGEGLHGHLTKHADKLSGIVNGIDVDAWNPADDGALTATFSADDLTGKATCRADLVPAEWQLPADEPLFGVVSRLAGQKGLELLLEVLRDDPGLALVILGSGEPDLEWFYGELAGDPSRRVWLSTGFDTRLAHRIYAGADATIVPSHFEPCGLAQMYAMRYGTVPVVRAVGGLRDTVIEDETGFCFAEPTADALASAIARARDCFRTDPNRWRAMMQRGMRADWSWTESARHYLELYRQL